MRFALLAALVLSGLLMAPAAEGAKRCRTGTVAVGPASKPKACVGSKLDGPRALKPLTKLGLKAPKGARRNAKTEKLAQRMLDLKLGRVARVARRSDDPVFGVERGHTEGPDGVVTVVYDRPDGIESRVTFGPRDFAIVELRDRTGAGHTIGLKKANAVPDCPRADGDVPAKLDQSLTFGQAVSEHGKRTWTLVTVRVEATWTGHVGVGAKAESFDFALRGELTIKSGVEIASTGKVLKRMPTRTYRSALTKTGVKIGTPSLSFAREFTLRGPKGRRADDADVQAASGLLTTSVMGIDELTDALEAGDNRWYDARACATLDHTSSPDKVVKGGRADWHVRVLAQDGTPVTAAAWSPASSCGTASWSGSPVLHMTVEDAGGAWTPRSTGACAAAEVTTPAGRPRPFQHWIPPVEAKRWRYDIKITFNKAMGAGIAETNAVGTGTVTIGEEDGLVEGAGTYAGTEWDSGPLNTCGQDMRRSRAFSSPATFGGEIQSEEVTLGFTANERPFEAAWIVTVPVTGGTRTITARQPFCGTPQMALTTSTIVISATPVS